MAGARNRTARVLTRAVLLGAVLTGLFLMHGAPGAASGGCHGGVTSLGAMAGTAGTAHHDMLRAGTADPAGSAAAGWTPAHQAGGLCLAAPVRSVLHLIQPGLLLLAVIALLAAALLAPSAPAGRLSERGPPGGRILLTRVCVSRT